MSTQRVLLDLIRENERYLHSVLDEISEACLHWLPDPGALSIAVTLWHCARAIDVFKTLHIDDRPAGEELWFTGGWAETTGYDPRGIGTHGWGQITGYTQEEVAAIPPMDRRLLREYTDAVLAAERAYVEATPDEVLFATAPGFEGQQTNYFWVRHPLLDMCRHMGEVLAFKEMYARLHPGGRDAAG